MEQAWDRIQKHPETGKKEPTKAYDCFEQYLSLGRTRTLPKLKRHLEGTPLTLSERQLKRYSSTWNWVERAEKYDEYIILRRRLRREEDIERFIDLEIPTIKENLDLINENMQEIHESEAKATSKAHAYEKNTKAQSNSINALLLLSGKPTEITDNNLSGNLEHDVNVEPVEIDVTSDEFLNRQINLIRKFTDDN